MASGAAPNAFEALVPTGEEGDRRLGLDEPPGWWPTIARLKSDEAAGFRYVQVSLPGREVLAETEVARSATPRSRAPR